MADTSGVELRGKRAIEGAARRMEGFPSNDLTAEEVRSGSTSRDDWKTDYDDWKDVWDNWRDGPIFENWLDA